MFWMCWQFCMAHIKDIGLLDYFIDSFQLIIQIFLLKKQGINIFLHSAHKLTVFTTAHNVTERLFLIASSS